MIASLVGEDLSQPDIIEWARDASVGLSDVPDDRTLMPMQCLGIFHYSRRNYEAAIEAFQQALASGVDCDTTARSGYWMAETYFAMENKIGALAAIRVTRDLVPVNAKKMPYGDRLETSILEETNAPSPTMVSEYMNSQFARLLAKARQNGQSDPAIAMLTR